LNINLLDIIPEQCVDDSVIKCCNQLWISVCENWSKFTEHPVTLFWNYEHEMKHTSFLLLVM